ncbi:MAG TPA: cytochrome c [Flavihumibacter sp.]|nr:cytochrome c [Flavihumibacter sp.]
MKSWWSIGAIVLLFSFGNSLPDPEKPVPVPATPQRTGDAVKGYQYLVSGDYVKGGLPLSLYKRALGKQQKDFLNRGGLNSGVTHDFTVVEVNGEQLVAPNCLQCHAQVFGDSLVMGMGNTYLDFSANQTMNTKNLAMAGKLLKLTAPAKYEASKNFLRVSMAVGPYLNTAVRGVNAADRLAAALVAHRDPVTFQWSDTLLMPLPDEVIPSDVPAWWLLKKKNAMFYNGFGRGDFGRFLMASNLLTVTDTAESAEVDRQISDVLAYLNTLKAPAYPFPIDKELAEKGALIYNDHCAKCHGNGDAYPNLLVPAAIINTDTALYSANYQNPQFVDWFNRSWFASGDHPAKLVPYQGYIAPPLDGVWCTAPYLHNGSVPTIEGVLNSAVRPAFWTRDFNKPEYDYQRLGWTYYSGDANSVGYYDTRKKGYGNNGHYFGDKLTHSDRKAVIEYLKTL